MLGTVFIRDFDDGVIRTFGGVLETVSVEGGSRQEYVVGISGITGPPGYNGKLPVYFVVGKGAFRPKYLPAVIVRRSEIEPAMQNGGQSWGIEAVVASPGAPQAVVVLPNGQSVSGPTRLTQKPPATPYNITYDISVRCRGPRAMNDAALALKHLLSIAEPPGCAVSVKDSVGDTRTYDGITQSIADITEVLDLTSRDAGWTINLVVHGELDIIEPFETKAVTQTATNISVE